jgi:hypothetical protein
MGTNYDIKVSNKAPREIVLILKVIKLGPKVSSGLLVDRGVNG